MKEDGFVTYRHSHRFDFEQVFLYNVALRKAPQRSTIRPVLAKVLQFFILPFQNGALVYVSFI